MKTGRVFSARQAAKLLKIDGSALRRLLQQGKIRAQKTPERWEISLGEIRRWARFRAALTSEDLFTGARAARVLGISRQAVHQKLQEGSLKFTMIGPRRFIPRGALEEALQSRKQAEAKVRGA